MPIHRVGTRNCAKISKRSTYGTVAGKMVGVNARTGAACVDHYRVNVRAARRKLQAQTGTSRRERKSRAGKKRKKNPPKKQKNTPTPAPVAEALACLSPLYYILTPIKFPPAPAGAVGVRAADARRHAELRRDVESNDPGALPGRVVSLRPSEHVL